MTEHPVDRWLQIAKNRDLPGLAALLADEVVFHSPVVHTPQRGKAITTQYLAAALQVFGNASFAYVRQVRGERDAVLEFTLECEGVHINGVDLVAWNDEGRITEFKVMLRPLKAMLLMQQKMAAMMQANQ